MARRVTQFDWNLQYTAQYLDAKLNEHFESNIFSLQGEPNLRFKLRFLAKNAGKPDQPIMYLDIVDPPERPVDIECTFWLSDGQRVQTTKKTSNVLN